MSLICFPLSFHSLKLQQPNPKSFRRHYCRRLAFPSRSNGFPSAITSLETGGKASAPTFQEAIQRLQEYWASVGCLIMQCSNTEVGAGTMNPLTFLRVLGPEPWNVAYVEPSVRPDDSRYGDNPNRLQRHSQFQVILKPDPGNAQDLFIRSLSALGSSWFHYLHLMGMYMLWKFLVPLPPPYGLVHLGQYYRLLTLFCFVAMPNAVQLTDGADGLVGGVSAWAFVGMSIAVLPISAELAIFGISMAGASVGFLFHNRYKASILLGDVGSLGLGGALSTMAACTGMFFPLFICSGVFILEALSVVLQVIVLKVTIRRKGVTRLISRVTPLQQQLKLFGLKVPLIVASSYVVSSILAMLAGYIGLLSA